MSDALKIKVNIVFTLIFDTSDVSIYKKSFMLIYGIALWDSISDKQFEFLCQNHQLNLRKKVYQRSLLFQEAVRKGKNY